MNVTETSTRPKWLISHPQVHPDKHPGFPEEAIAAAARVNQAMDVRSRHVHEVYKCVSLCCPFMCMAMGHHGITRWAQASRQGPTLRVCRCVAAVLRDLKLFFLGGGRIRFRAKAQSSRRSRNQITAG